MGKKVRLKKKIARIDKRIAKVDKKIEKLYPRTSKGWIPAEDRPEREVTRKGKKTTLPETYGTFKEGEKDLGAHHSYARKQGKKSKLKRKKAKTEKKYWKEVMKDIQP